MTGERRKRKTLKKKLAEAKAEYIAKYRKSDDGLFS